MPESTPATPPAFNYAGMAPINLPPAQALPDSGPAASNAAGGGTAAGSGGASHPAPAALIDNLDAGARSVL